MHALTTQLSYFNSLYGKNLGETVRKTRTFLTRRKAPCWTAIQKLVKKLERLKKVNNLKNKKTNR